MEELKDRLTGRMKEYFGEDERRTQRALRVTGYAESILQHEEGANGDVVIAAALLHDIGIDEAEWKHGSSAGKYQEIEGPPKARKLVLVEGLPDSMIKNRFSGKG